MTPYFDAHLLAAPLSAPPAHLSGGVIFGGEAARIARQAGPGFMQAGALDALVGPNDARYPAADPPVIDLQIDEAPLMKMLTLGDSAWYPLCGIPREHALIVRFNLAAGNRAAAGISRLARKFLRTRFLIDPFAHGFDGGGWQSQVRLAEADNIFITTLGMSPGARCCWSDSSQVSEAMYFVIGEVGAGKLLWASGDSISATPQTDPEEWLAKISFLEPAQRELILRGNAVQLGST